MLSVMYDIETLGTAPDSIIVSLGACRFSFENDVTDKMALLLDLNEQHDLGRKASMATLTWWMKQSREARDWNFNSSNQYPCVVALRAFATFCQGADLFWCRGTNFDPILLESLFKQFDLEVPWRYNNLRDVRTFDELVKPMASLDMIAHKPLDDCLVQVEQVREVYRVFAQAMELKRARTMGRAGWARPEGMGIAKLAEEIPSETLEDSLASSGPTPGGEPFGTAGIQADGEGVDELLAEEPLALPRDPDEMLGRDLDEKLVTDEVRERHINESRGPGRTAAEQREIDDSPGL